MASLCAYRPYAVSARTGPGGVAPAAGVEARSMRSMPDAVVVVRALGMVPDETGTPRDRTNSSTRAAESGATPALRRAAASPAASDASDATGAVCRHVDAVIVVDAIERVGPDAALVERDVGESLAQPTRGGVGELQGGRVEGDVAGARGNVTAGEQRD